MPRPATKMHYQDLIAGSSVTILPAEPIWVEAIVMSNIQAFALRFPFQDLDGNDVFAITPEIQSITAFDTHFLLENGLQVVPPFNGFSITIFYRPDG